VGGAGSGHAAVAPLDVSVRTLARAWPLARDIDAHAFKITENSDTVFFVLIGREDISARRLKIVGNEIIKNLGLCYPLLQHEYIFGRWREMHHR
jgi:hypothetical protein